MGQMGLLGKMGQMGRMGQENEEKIREKSQILFDGDIFCREQPQKKALPYVCGRA